MIRMICGKIGGGKTYFALREIVEELVYGSRVVVTNVALKLPELNEYLQCEYPDKTIDLDDRVRIITREQTKFFWLCREHGVDIPYIGKELEQRGETQNFEGYVKRPVFYVIDEVHVSFDARNWMGNGLSLTFYNSQHRKFNDEIIFITQFLELVDKRVKGFAQEFLYVRNNSVERILYFRGPSYFTVKTYLEPKTGVTDHPMETHRFQLKPALAACYDTSAGVGISGRNKPEEKKKKGLPFWAMLLVGAALVYAVTWIPKVISGGLGHVFKAATPVLEATKMEAPIQLEGAKAPPAINLGEQAYFEEEVFVRGYIVRNGRVNVYMSDGTTYTERDPVLEELQRNAVRIRGKLYPLRTQERPKPPVRLPQATAPEVQDSVIPDVGRIKETPPIVPIDSGPTERLGVGFAPGSFEPSGW